LCRVWANRCNGQGIVTKNCPYKDHQVHQNMSLCGIPKQSATQNARHTQCYVTSSTVGQAAWELALWSFLLKSRLQWEWEGKSMRDYASQVGDGLKIVGWDSPLPLCLLDCQLLKCQHSSLQNYSNTKQHDQHQQWTTVKA
jgi:hypothetical protein